MATFNSTSTGSSSASSLLNENDDMTGVLVYRYRTGSPRLEVQSQKTLSKALKANPRTRLSCKRIPRGNSRVNVRMEDLYTDEQRSMYSDKPNYQCSLASVGLPKAVYWKNLLFNSFPNLYIVSPVSSPENSPENSQNITPRNTFGVDHDDQTTTGQSSSVKTSHTTLGPDNY